MKKAFLFVLIVFAAWYGWKHGPQFVDEFVRKRPQHEAVVVNNTGHVLERVRVTVGGQTFVKETLADNDRAVFPFRVESDSDFELRWQYQDKMGEGHWKGGMVPKGPMVQRHIMTIDAEAQIIYQPENK